MKIQNTPNRAAFDVRSAQDVKDQFRQDPKAGLKAAAEQFETMFLQMVMKSMRDATPQDGLMNSDQTRFYTSMLDQQLAQDATASGKGLGFARLIEQQLGRQVASTGAAPDTSAAANAAATPLPLATSDGRHLQYRPVPSTLPTSASYPAAGGATEAPRTQGVEAEPPGNATEFVNRVWPHAVEASRATGIPPQFLVAHAALETAWGRSEPRQADGSGSNNLFGVKAGKRWSGPTADSATTEYVNGQPQQSVERFRAYASYEDSFRDYAQLLRNNPRFSSVIGSQTGTEFARRLQQAGYATDPMYADKLTRIINGPTLRQALIG